MKRSFLPATGLIAAVLLGVWASSSAWRSKRDGEGSSNTGVAARIVGSAACRNCHGLIADCYDTSGHAHTFSLAAVSEVARQLSGKEFADPQRNQLFRYHFDPNGLSASLPNVFEEERFPLTYALGSGTHGVTFLTLLPRRDGATVGLEHRVSYYRQLAGLGLTVGHNYLKSPIEDSEHFGKVVEGRQLQRCIGCHTTQARIEEHQLVDLIPHVGCEKCHGPGSAHVAAQQARRTTPDLSVARRWPTALEELRTCGACHRLPESLKATELVRTSRVLPRFQPAGLMQSRCYTQSAGTLRCTTCHDPHARVLSDHRHYEQICRDCHQRQSVAACSQGGERCVQCHMPAIPFEGVASFHDHWIRIRKADDPVPLPAED